MGESRNARTGREYMFAERSMVGRSIMGGVGVMDKPVILFLTADPEDAPQLDHTPELLSIHEGAGERYTIVHEEHVQFADVYKHLVKYRPSIVHFSGHGSDEGDFLFEDKDRDEDPGHARSLVNILGTCKSLELIVFSACSTARRADAIALSKVPVVAITREIGAGSAADFFRNFYLALGDGEDVRAAFSIAYWSMNNRPSSHLFRLFEGSTTSVWGDGPPPKPKTKYYMMAFVITAIMVFTSGILAGFLSIGPPSINLDYTSTNSGCTVCIGWWDRWRACGVGGPAHLTLKNSVEQHDCLVVEDPSSVGGLTPLLIQCNGTKTYSRTSALGYCLNEGSDLELNRIRK